MLSGLWSNVKMVQALTILSALQLFSEGLPGAEGSGEPYGISRGVVEGAARAGSALNPKTHDDGDIRAGVPVPALSQVSPTAAPSSSNGLLNRPINNRHGEAQRPDMPGCSVGLFGKGVIRFERIPNWHLARPNTDMLRRSEAPADVLFMCQDLCLKNSTGHNQRQFCNSVDFVPGERISHMTFTESKCFLSTPNETPGQLPQYRPAPNQYHYREVCYGGEGMDQPTAATDCPERLYVMERSLNMRFMPKGARQVHANTLEMCQQMCLSQAVEDPLMTTSICRAGTFDYQNSRCYLSTFTRRTHPEEMLEDPNFSYFENTCLDVERRCPQNKLIWTMEVKKELKGPFDSLLYQNVSLKECQALCLKNSNIFCRSIEYDERAKMCTLSDEDSVSQPSGIQDALSDQNLYLELRCIYRDSEESGQSVRQGAENTRERQPLSDRDLRDVYTAFQLIRNRVLELSPGFRETGREGRAVSLAECLDQCLEEAMFPCRSAIYSESRRLCRLSEYDRINGKLAYDDDFDYYENIMGGSTQSDSSFTRFKGDSFEDSSGRFPSFGGTRFLDDRFSQSGNRFDANRFESNKGGGLSRFHAQDSQNDRFSGAFNRFHESKFDRTGTRFSDSDFYQGNRDIAGTFGSRVSNEGFSDDRFDNDRRLSGNKGFSSDRRFLDDRWGSSDDRKFSSERRFSDERRFSGDRRFVDDRRFGSGGTFSGDRRFDTTRFQSGGDTKRFQTGGSFFSSGADVASLRPNSGGVNTQLPNRNRFGSGGFSSFGLGSSSSFGSSSSGFGFGGGGNSIDHSGFGPASADGTRHEVSQQCNPDGSMEFMLRTEESFRGRIYTFGYYDRCFTRGGGSSVNVLKISPPRSFPECGTVRYGDTTTNIVVVQFADGVMTSRDKRYNLTCTTIGPGDSVVTSAYIGAGLGAPIPIEYLPEESRLDSQVRLQILYQGRPTTTVAVGDPLTFRVESMTGRELVSDIFVTNVAVRDVLTGRSIELIDRRGCPVREEIFPALGRARSGNGVETRFSGFKMPETNMLYFEAKVRACKRQCEPARCSGGRGRTEQYSMGKKRRRRSTNDEDEGSDQYDEYDFNVDQDEHGVASTTENPGDAPFHLPSIPPTGADEGEDQEADNEWLQDRDEPLQDDNDEPLPELGDEEAKLNEVIKVYMYENEAEEHRIEEAAALTRKDVCVALSEYYSLLAALLVTGLLLLASLFVMGLCFRKQKKLQTKNAIADESNPCPPHRRAVFPGSHARTVNQPARYFPSSEDKSRPTFDLEGRSGGGNRFPDPSEPIYTDPALFERSPQSEVSSSSAKL